MANKYLSGLSPKSRFLNTPVHLDDAVKPGTLRFGRWRAPDIDMTAFGFHAVATPQIGRIDLISVQHYGTSELWWAIALVNNLANPFDMSEGQVLKIPLQSAIVAAMAQRS